VNKGDYYQPVTSGWKRGGGEGADRPGWHHPGGWHPVESWKNFAPEFRKTILEKRLLALEGGEGGWEWRRWRKKVKKIRHFFEVKIGWHHSVTAPGDTNLSDATVTSCLLIQFCPSFLCHR